jgi:hypothetical protein
LTKTPIAKPLPLALLLVATSLAVTPLAPAATVPAATHPAETRLEASPPPYAPGAVNGSADQPGMPWDGGAGRSGFELGPGGAPVADPLPLSKFTGPAAVAPAPATGETRSGVLGFLKSVKDSGLPEPASWALILIGFGMIGAAIRGFVLANRNLSRLQPDDSE